MVVPSPLGWEPIATRPRSPWRWLVGVLVAMIIAVVVLNTISVPYFALLPGKAQPVNGAGADVKVNSVFKGSGDLYLATVLLTNRVTVWDQLVSFLHPDTQLIKKVDLTGGATSQQFARLNQVEMEDSQEFAKVAALRRLGYQVPEHGDGALILQVQPGSPADGVLDPGDVIKKIDTTPINLALDATKVLRSHRPGDRVNLEISRPSPPTSASPSTSSPTTIQVTVRPIECGQLCPGEPHKPIVGVGLGTDHDSYAIPKGIGLDISTTNIGGPSAGLAFALGAIDALTTGRITGGHRVAVTGTIDPDGGVGPVGGVQQKLVAVSRAGCEYFLVPPEEYPAAVKKAKGRHLTIAKVATLDDALRFLQSIGGDLSGVPARSPLPGG